MTRPTYAQQQAFFDRSAITLSNGQRWSCPEGVWHTWQLDGGWWVVCAGPTCRTDEDREKVTRALSNARNPIR
jgi:hypothetical protein